MTIEEMAKKSANEKFSPDEKYPKLAEMLVTSYIEDYNYIAVEILNSLLEELPEALNEREGNYQARFGYNSCLGRIKLIIKNKLG